MVSWQWMGKYQMRKWKRKNENNNTCWWKYETWTWEEIGYWRPTHDKVLSAFSIVNLSYSKWYFTIACSICLSSEPATSPHALAHALKKTHFLWEKPFTFYAIILTFSRVTFAINSHLFSSIKIFSRLYLCLIPLVSIDSLWMVFSCRLVSATAA